LGKVAIWLNRPLLLLVGLMVALLPWLLAGNNLFPLLWLPLIQSVAKGSLWVAIDRCVAIFKWRLPQRNILRYSLLLLLAIAVFVGLWEQGPQAVD